MVHSGLLEHVMVMRGQPLFVLREATIGTVSFSFGLQERDCHMVTIQHGLCRKMI
jgi:hypothetical protein